MHTSPLTHLFDIVKERPLAELPTDPARCPHCESADVKITGHTTTLVGYSGPVNNNHQWFPSLCRGCGKTYVREIKGLNVWYTAGPVRGGSSQVLRGMPSCSEGYQYSCAKCEGPVLRKYRDKGGAPAGALLSAMYVDGKWVRDYTAHYGCTQCGHGGETEGDYWDGKTREVPLG